MKILVSACLLGIHCKYSGGSNLTQGLVEALQAAGHSLVPVCPEVYGGLPTPRTPAERVGERVLAKDGRDVTAEYRNGAAAAVRLAQLTGCTAAVLKANSPSSAAAPFMTAPLPGARFPAAALPPKPCGQPGWRFTTRKRIPSCCKPLQVTSFYSL